MDELFTGLKSEFPSLSDDDAAKATQAISQVAPQIAQPQPSIQPVQPQMPIDPGNDTQSPIAEQPVQGPAQPSLSPAPSAAPAIPEDPESKRSAMVREYLMNKSDPEVLNKLREKYKQSITPDWRDNLSTALSFLPRGRRFAGAPVAGKNRDAALAKYELSEGNEAIKELRAQDEFEKIKLQKEKREQQTFELEHPEEAKDINSPLSQAGKLAFQNMTNQAGMQKLGQVAEGMNYNQMAKVAKDFGVLPQFQEAAKNHRANMVDARARETHQDTLNAREDAKSGKDSKIENDLFDKAEKRLAVGNLRGGALSVEAKKANLAKHLKALATDQNGQIKNLTNIGEEELGMGLATMVGGGNQQAAATFHRVVPSYLQKDLGMAAQYLKGNPQILNDKDFVQNFYDSATRQGDISREIIKAAQIEGLPSIEGAKIANPERYQRLLKAHDIDEARDIDENGRYKGGQKMAPDEAKNTLGSGEVLRDVDGKKAIFDSNTKKFIRWK